MGWVGLGSAGVGRYCLVAAHKHPGVSMGCILMGRVSQRVSASPTTNNDVITAGVLRASAGWGIHFPSVPEEGVGKLPGSHPYRATDAGVQGLGVHVRMRELVGFWWDSTEPWHQAAHAQGGKTRARAGKWEGQPRVHAARHRLGKGQGRGGDLSHLPEARKEKMGMGTRDGADGDCRTIHSGDC